MVVMWWDTMSCSSRAMRRRSSATARSARSRRFASTSRCQRLTAAAAPMTRTVARAVPTRSILAGHGPLIRSTKGSARLAEPAAAVTRTLPPRTTVNRATTSAAERPRGPAITRLITAPSASAPPNAATGCRRRTSSGSPDTATAASPGTVAGLPSSAPLRE
ncbi:hypothetical protein SMD44_08662 [Streptomyces alboflavus]|uniref:Uncharacterized protein n=1 Tax=Streptomyces alboflavus TaxID=67267 RepID=A0A1Z1WRW9_9ACTN|nr:hypothetical protein SMD44_08662 [Streptomyces alboflavus]